MSTFNGQKNMKDKRELNLSFSSDLSFLEVESDPLSLETPLMTSEDGRSSSNSDTCKSSKISFNSYGDRESQV